MKTLELRSRAFDNGTAIPTRYTCEGQDVSPPLTWEGAPDETRSFVLIVDDPDAPDPSAPKRTWVHWVIYNLPADTTELTEGVARLPHGARHGLNDWKRTDYGGPCPPIGRHRYFFKLYALNVTLPELGELTKKDLEEAMKGHVVAQAELMGTYAKHT